MKPNQIINLLGTLGIIFAVGGFFLSNLAIIVSFVIWVIMGFVKIGSENLKSPSH